MEKYILKSQKETKTFAAKFARQISLAAPQKTAVVLALSGELGAGKTTFTQGFAAGLGIKEKVLSPTFVVMKKFKVPISNFKSSPKSKTQKTSIPTIGRPSKSEYKAFYHFDCYRLENPKDILYLGFEEIISNPENIVLIEWPEKIKKLLPKKSIKIKFKHLKDGNRELTIRF